uniref:OTU domain-containing protein n=1 Tax=Cannabis sativa TaxID=3483 RepID=A0A803NJP9_CANSA
MRKILTEKEISTLQNKEIELKKAAAKGSKAEQKAKKKQVEKEITKRSFELKEKHAEELASLGYDTKNGNKKSKLENLVKAIARVSVSNQPDQKMMVTMILWREKLENSCKEVERQFCTGRSVELEALTHYLRKHIMVFSGSFPDVEMGKEYKSNSGTDTSIRLSYHKHAFGLGEHYNSVVPIVTK